MSPLATNWSHDVAPAGTEKASIQSLLGQVSPVPPLPHPFGSVKPVENERNVPAEWHAILAGLERRGRLTGLADRWRWFTFRRRELLIALGQRGDLLGLDCA